MEPPSPQTLKRHGITAEQWRQMYDEQGGQCAICRKPPRTILVIDHDHRAARKGLPAIRGLACPLCNGKLGKVRDDADWCENAAAYLRRGATVSTPYPKPVKRRKS